MFLIYNSMTFSVVQRRPLFGTLRCLGVTRGEIARLVLGEAAIVGIVGSALGIGLGVLLGQGAVRLVTQTINDLYFVVTIRGIVIPPESLVKGALAGIAATVASALAPAWEASTVPPRLALTRSGLEDRARRLLPVLSLGGLLSIALGLGLLLVRTRSLEISFAGLFFLTIGFALLAPLTTVVISRLVLRPASAVFGPPGRLAPRSVTGALSRTAVAIAALMVAVSVTIGVGLMVGSFRTTVVDWLAQTLWGDVYVSAPAPTATRSAAAARSRGHPGRRDNGRARGDGTSCGRRMCSRPTGPVAVTAVSDEDFTAPRIFVSTDGTRDDVRRAVKNGAVLASEPLANRLNLPARGATVTLFTDHGPRTFPVAGIYRDYSNSQGTVMMGLDLYRQQLERPDGDRGAPCARSRARRPTKRCGNCAPGCAGHPGRHRPPECRAAPRCARGVRPGICDHRRAPAAGGHRRVYRRAGGAALAAAGTGAGDGTDARGWAYGAAVARPGVPGNRADGRGGRPARDADRARRSPSC